MYRSVKAWLKVPVQVKRFIKRSGTGAKIYADEILEYKCYPQACAEVVVNADGEEAKSMTKFYVDGSCEISSSDNVIYEGKERPIINVTTYYDGRTGLPDIKVVYL